MFEPRLDDAVSLPDFFYLLSYVPPDVFDQPDAVLLVVFAALFEFPAADALAVFLHLLVVFADFS